MAFEAIDNLPIDWKDHEDVAMKLYERFGDDLAKARSTGSGLRNLSSG